MQEKDILDQKLPGKWDALQDGLLHLAVMFWIMFLIWIWAEGKNTITIAFGVRFYEISKGLILISAAIFSGGATFKTIKLAIKIKQFKIVKEDDK